MPRSAADKRCIGAARLWQHDQARLDKLREELEAMKVPRCYDITPERVARGLLARHQKDAPAEEGPFAENIPESGLRVRPGSITRWIQQLDNKIHDARA